MAFLTQRKIIKMNQINTSILDLAICKQMKNPAENTLVEQLSYLIDTAKLTIEYVAISIGFSINKIARAINAETKENNEIFSVFAEGKLANEKPLDLEKAKMLADYLMQDDFHEVKIRIKK